MSAGLDVGALASRSVFDAAAWARPPERFAPPLPGEPALPLARVPGVTWLPSLGLQRDDEGRVPLESVQDDWCLAFERERRFQGRAEAFAGGYEARDVDAEACVLGNFYSRNFFHWTSEELPKVLALEAAGFDGVYAVGALPAFAFDSLALLGVPPARILGAQDGPLRFRAAWYLPVLTARTLDRHPALVEALRARLLGAALGAPPPASGTRRLWLDRRLAVNNAGRELVNPEDVFPVLERHGVEVLDPGGLPLREQLRATGRAALLSGPHGAGFIHALFQPAGSAVLECYSPEFINPGVFAVCRLLRHRYAMVVHENAYGSYRWGTRLFVDAGQLELALASLG